MRGWVMGRINDVVCLSLAGLVVWGSALAGDAHGAAGEEAVRIVFAPPNGKGPSVIVISGYSGPNLYRTFTAKLAEAGYYAVLLDGKDLFVQDGERGPNDRGKAHFRAAIVQAQQAPQSLPGKVAVIGLSLGGGAALSYATAMPEEVSAVIAYYPMTRLVADAHAFTARFRVPTLVFAGEQDRYGYCCPIETIRAIEAAAQARHVPFTLIVYPEADHAFNLPNVPTYRRDEARDAWQRTLQMLRQYQPLP